MDFPQGAKVCCAADIFNYDETKAVNLRKFFSQYKDQFPMLIVIIGGHYGDTKYDCYDNLQVLRVHCYTSQPRVVSDDPRHNPAARVGYISIPECSCIKFRKVKGHMKVGNPQSIRDILQEHGELPLQVQFACDPSHPIRVGMSRHAARDFGNFLIKEKYMEHFFIMNCIDGVELKMNKLTCMACLSEDLDATPVTGFKYKSQAEFDEFCRKLSEEVANSGEVYDKTAGNGDLNEYSFEEMRSLLDVSEYKSGILTDSPESDEALEEDDEYEEIPPVPPPRDAPRHTAPTDNAQHQRPETKPKNKPPTAAKPKHNKSANTTDKDKETKGVFGFFNKKHREAHDRTGEQAGETSAEKVHPNTAHKAHAAHKSHVVQSQTPAPSKTAPKLPPHVSTKPAAKSHNKSNQRILPNSAEHAEYVTLRGHSYQNTQIGRATVKPMPRTNVTTQVDEDDLIKKAKEEEDDDYDYVDEQTTANLLGQSVQDSRGVPSNPVMNELRQKIEGHAYVEHETQEDYEDIDVGQGKTADEYLVPGTAHHPTPPARKKNPGSDSLRRTENKVDELSSEVQKQESSDENYQSSAKLLSIKEVAQILAELKLGKYTDIFEDNRIDGEILTSLSVDDFVNELGLKKLEAVRLHKFAETGHIPR